jgi:magnesium transporter
MARLFAPFKFFLSAPFSTLGSSPMLINCVAYQNGYRIGQVTREQISEYVARPDCFVWVALCDATAEELLQMQHEFGLHPLAVEDAQHGHQRPKIEEYGESLFAVIQTLELVHTELHIGEVDVFVGANFVLSVRNRTQRGFQDVRERCEREPEFLKRGAGYVMYALMDAVVDRYFPILDNLEQTLETIEARIFSGGSARENVESLYKLKQQLMTLRHAAAPLLDSVGKLYGGRVPPVCNGMQDYFRDVYDHLVRLNQSIESLREMVTTAISVNLSLITLTESETTKRLAAYAALVAVPTMIAGIYGMNFEHMPELKWLWGYPLAVGAMLIVDVWLFYRFKKSGWL